MVWCSDARYEFPPTQVNEPESHRDFGEPAPLAGSAQGRDPGW